MTSRPVQVELPTGDIIWVQTPTDGLSNVSAGALKKLDVDELRKTMGGLTATLRDALDDFTPDEMQIEFGLQLSIKSGKLTSMIAEAGGQATVKVSMLWRRDDEPPSVNLT